MRETPAMSAANRLAKILVTGTVFGLPQKDQCAEKNAHSNRDANHASDTPASVGPSSSTIKTDNQGVM